MSPPLCLQAGSVEDFGLVVGGRGSSLRCKRVMTRTRATGYLLLHFLALEDPFPPKNVSLLSPPRSPTMHHLGLPPAPPHCRVSFHCHTERFWLAFAFFRLSRFVSRPVSATLDFASLCVVLHFLCCILCFVSFALYPSFPFAISATRTQTALCTLLPSRI